MLYPKVKYSKKEVSFYWKDTQWGTRYVTHGPSTYRSMRRWLRAYRYTKSSTNITSFRDWLCQGMYLCEIVCQLTYVIIIVGLLSYFGFR